MELSPGKHWRMRRLAGATGHLTMLAVDQRPPIELLVSTARREPRARPTDVAAVKRLLVEELAGSASAVLIDPLLGYDAAREYLDPSRGLLLTLEHAAFEETPDGRLSGPIPGWSVEAIAEAGADGVKALVWYRPDAGESVRRHQLAWAAEIGAECRRLQLPYVLELLLYPLPARPVPDDIGQRATAVLDSVRAFAQPEIGVDVFKVESPVPPAMLEGSATEAGQAHLAWFRELDAACGRPWVVLSAGAGPETFLRVVEHATTAGASGFLAGRAIWQASLSAFPDLEACRRGLREIAVPFATELAELASRRGRPWFRHPAYGAQAPAVAPVMERS